ncbi:MAG: cobalamin biosynthesis protein [Dehalococcoidia bacterium]|nr:cobalamin biosynthesis protein [Dehalococcoidia bacterium]
MENLWVLLLAVAWDLALGEPPAPLHPVVWMGKAIGFLEKWAPAGKADALVYGGATTLLVVGLFAGTALLFLDYLRGVSPIAYTLVGAYLLKSSFSLRELYRAGARMRQSLSQKALASARQEARSLVSRDVESLDESRLVSATVESLAENLSDSLLAPTLYFLVLGVPGALAYRTVNTLDAMIGYRGKYEHLGKIAARLDDLLNYVPARLGAMLVIAGAFLTRQNVRGAWRIMRRDGGRTESPNAGWPMAAAAGALGLQLEKPGHYRLGDARGPLSPEKIDSMLAILGWAAALWLLACAGTEAILVAI